MIQTIHAKIIITTLIATASFAFAQTNSQIKMPTFLKKHEWSSYEEVERLFQKNEALEQLKAYAATAPIPEDPSGRISAQILLGRHSEAANTLTQLEKDQAPYHYFHVTLFLAAAELQKNGMSETEAFAKAFRQAFQLLNNTQAVQAGYYSSYSMRRAWPFLRETFHQTKSNPFNHEAGSTLIQRFTDAWVHKQVLTHTLPLLKQEYHKRFKIQDDILIKTPDGAQLSAIIVLPKNASKPLPAAMAFNIYTEYYFNLREAAYAASMGYAGVLADARGKGRSPDTPQPYETEGKDTNAVIDWIARQPWCTGEVAMYGGSYLGFAAWAATKNIHPALKTIVPYAAAIPGQGLPMENNIFLNANYAWSGLVTNHKHQDWSVYDDSNRFFNLNQRYFQEGRAYRELDAIDGTPSPWLQKWLKHPSYDAYWQAMVPYQDDYRNINIPVLSFTGYYDDGQISAVHYLDQHYKYNPDAQHYLVIGPYDHATTQGTQAPTLRGYNLDPSAHIDVKALTFKWFDHIFKNGARPHPVRDRINLQIMGGDKWRHLKGWDELQKGKKRFYLSNIKTENYTGNGVYKLSHKPQKGAFLKQTVDLADRTQELNHYYPWPIIRRAFQENGPKNLPISNGFAFISEPFAKETIIQGRFSGEMKVRINKKDFDLGLVFYELTEKGEIFHLSYYLGRASYANDMSKRTLLQPNTPQTVPFHRTRMTGKLLQKGSRLLVRVNVNKNRNAQINYGTGKDVSDETIADAGVPLEIDWFLNSYIEVSFADWDQ